MEFFYILILAMVQGIAELLPVSSSAHVIVAEKLMGLDPTSPQMTMILVMLHTGTMFAVIAYFWKSWRETYFASAQQFRANGANLVIATIATGVVGFGLQMIIKHFFAENADKFEIEHLFGNAKLMAAALASAGVLIILSSRMKEKGNHDVNTRSALWIRAVQFSFALAVVLTPAVIVKEAVRLFKVESASTVNDTAVLLHALLPGLLGMVLSFLTGLIALRWLSRWLEQGRWHFFGAYCLFASLVVLWVG